MGNNNLISSKKTYYISIAILAGMFFIFGFVVVLSGAYATPVREIGRAHV